jgi:uncharacterized NAD(P)/FAD-binding protein YdhS
MGVNAVAQRPAPPRVAVIGGGFCGAFFAAQLARHSQVPVTISIVEPRAMLGGGVAYSTTDPAHRINVPAARMTLFPDKPTDFDDWFRRSGGLDADPEALWSDGSVYPRRAVFGRYVAEIVASQHDDNPVATIDHVEDQAISVERVGESYSILLAQGGKIAAEIVVLATSHPPPGLPAIIASRLADDPGLIANPWAPGALEKIGPNEDVLIIGTGLTMADMVASLSRRGHKGHITAFSRRGLLPRGHSKRPVPIPFTWFTQHEAPRNLLELTRQVRAFVAEARDDKLPWQAVFDDVRSNGQRIWRGFDTAEKRRFLRHLRVFWDAHRYRIAPQVEKILEDKQRDGSLHVFAASLCSVERQNDKINIGLQPRRRPKDPTQHVTVDRVIITTGPSHGTVVDQNPALSSLSKQGLLQADCLSLGIRVDAFGQVINSAGVSEPTSLVVGPLAREQYGELMGLPQVATQPNAVAEHVALYLASRKLPANLDRN